MIVALDAMGGDFAPKATVEGALLAKKESPDVEFILVGDKNIIQEALTEAGADKDTFKIVHASQVIQMGEHPTKAINQKQDSSIIKGYQLLMEKKADAFASAGNTGAMLVGAMFTIKTVEGLLRPGIIGFIPNAETGKHGVLLDIGANAECKPETLEQFGELGSIYSQNALGNSNPRVALVNVGEEEQKGTTNIQAAYQLLKQNPKINFIGNIEGRDIFFNKADVVVCDGFTGNVILKLAESFYDLTSAKNIEHPFLDLFNYAKVGGSPILGVNGNVMIGHGVSSPAAIKSMLLQAVKLVDANISEKISNSFTAKV